MSDTLLLGGEREKVLHSPPTPSKKMCGETPQGPSSGTSDMCNNNKKARCNTGGLATVVEWETDVWDFLI